MAMTTNDIRDSFRMVYPNDLFYVCKHASSRGASSYYGSLLLYVELYKGDYLSVYKLSRSLGPIMSSDEIKQKAFAFIYDTRNITNDVLRRDQLRRSLRPLFPKHNVNVFIFDKHWDCASYDRGNAVFKYQYGSDVCVVLS